MSAVVFESESVVGVTILLTLHYCDNQLIVTISNYIIISLTWTVILENITILFEIPEYFGFHSDHIRHFKPVSITVCGIHVPGTGMDYGFCINKSQSCLKSFDSLP